MKFFIDSADVKEIREANEMGCIDGVTTNPSLLAKVKRTREEAIPEICSIVNGPVSAECVELAAPALIREGKGLAKLHPNVVVKVPMGVEGMKAVRGLAAEGIKTNVTVAFTANQALLAAKAGATYISPFIGRLDDTSTDGMQVVREIIKIYRNYGFKTQVLVASIRSPMHVLAAATEGADVATIPLSVIKQLAEHPLTDVAIKKFLADWEKLQGRS